MKNRNEVFSGLASKILILCYIVISDNAWCSAAVQHEAHLLPPGTSSSSPSSTDAATATTITTEAVGPSNNTSSSPTAASNPLNQSSQMISGVSNKLRDTIAWSSRLDPCRQEWRIVVPEHFGFAVEFHHVDMTGWDYLEIYSKGRNSSVLSKNFTKMEGGATILDFHCISRAPLLLYEREMVIQVHSSCATYHVSSFNLSYTALNDSLPPVAHHLPEMDPTESDVTYNCSGMTRLPEVISCDGIRHCAGGEDEANCSYTQQGCEGWVPYKNHCLKITFVRWLKITPGESHITMPLQAEYACQSLHNATLALLPDYTGIRIVSDLIRQSGFQTAAVGIKKVMPVSRRLRHLYRYLWQWGERGGPVAYEQQTLQRAGTSLGCAMLVVDPSPYLQPVECVLSNPAPQGYVCMRPNPAGHLEMAQLSKFTFSKPASSFDQFPTKPCADGSLVQTFHRCHWDGMEVDEEENWSPSGFKLFQCDSMRTIHYSLLCDGKSDCNDGSDERDCRHPQFSALLGSSFICRNGQAISKCQRCNGVADCFDESDEDSCVSCGLQIMCRDVGCVPKIYVKYFSTCPTMPEVREDPLSVYLHAAVRLDGHGMSMLEQVPEEPEGLFCCHEGYCIPSFLLNNGERDCPEGEDEGIPIHNVTCLGFYRCHGSGSCVHRDYVCDGVYHCPDKDDEMYCQDSCPTDKGCVCEGQAFTCPQMIDPLQHLHLRYLDLSHATGVSLENVNLMEYLFYLNLSFCQMSQVTLINMPQLQTLDLSFNYLTEISKVHLRQLLGLRYLDLSNNPFTKSISGDFKSLPVLGSFVNLKSLKMLNISLKSLEDKMFIALSKLEYLDIRHNHIVNIGKDSLLGLRSLEVLHTDDSKLCCRYFHSSLTRCVAPVDELSSCSDLLAQDFFRVCLWTISIMAITGNVGVLVYRLCINRRTAIPTFRILVLNLCASDLLMGVYMMMIGLADVCFRGNYVAKEPEWTSSPGCVVAGVLSFVSSEVSAFVICLITLDRILVICFPLNAQLHLSCRATVASCCGVWLLGLTLAVVPILTGMEFYGQNGICLPLPITRRYFSGQLYAFSVFIILNLVLFLVIGVGQVCLYRALHNASLVTTCARREQDFTVARRLFLVVFTDFCCWFPICLLGILASSGVPISGQVNVWAAIFVLPVNSALNPFLYTLNHLKEQWKRKRGEGCRGKTITLNHTVQQS